MSTRSVLDGFDIIASPLQKGFAYGGTGMYGGLALGSITTNSARVLLAPASSFAPQFAGEGITLSALHEIIHEITGLADIPLAQVHGFKVPEKIDQHVIDSASLQWALRLGGHCHLPKEKK